MSDREYDGWEITNDSDMTKQLTHKDDGQIYVSKGMTSPGQPWEEWKPEVRKNGENIEIAHRWEVGPNEDVWLWIEDVMEEYWGDSTTE